MIANALRPPEWISSGAKSSGGRDLLGLRLPVQAIGNSLLDGITTVTPSVRYLALRAWLIHQYAQSGQADSWQVFTEFTVRIESALVLANLIDDRSIGGLIGSDEARKRLDLDQTHIQISSLVETPASTIYTGASDQLGISQSRDSAAPALVRERGLPLAQAVNQRLMSIPITKQLLRHDSLDRVSIDELRDLSSQVRIDRIPDDERELLLSALIPSEPRSTELNRIRTYAALLALASKHKSRPTERHFFDAACSLSRFDEMLLDEIADGWMTYCVRDSIAVTQESVLAAVMGEILGQPDEGRMGVDRTVVINALLERVNEHDSALRDLNLLSSSESMADLTFNELEKRLRSELSGSVMTAGVVRWSGTLIEPLLYRRALRSGAGALSLAVVAWIMADLRVGDAVREDIQGFRGLSYQGPRRLGLRDVVLPELERHRRENRSLREVAADMALRTIHQHLHIAWSRLQVDITRDVALLTTDGERLFPRDKSFGAGRTASRIQQALGWLDQLKLIDEAGITADGEVALQRALSTLTTGHTA